MLVNCFNKEQNRTEQDNILFPDVYLVHSHNAW